VPEAIINFDGLMPLDLEGFASAEAQVASLSDDIAYNNHDVDDGLRAGLFSIGDLADVPLVGPVFGEVADRWPDLEQGRSIHESVRRLINAMVTDLIAESTSRIVAAAPADADAIRALSHPVIAFSEGMAENDRALKAFLFTSMYRHDKVNRMAEMGSKVVRELFGLFLSQPEKLPAEWQDGTEGPGSLATARIAGDYIAGMTDRYALRVYNEHIGGIEVQDLI
jgi:dGTPase